MAEMPSSSLQEGIHGVPWNELPSFKVIINSGQRVAPVCYQDLPLVI
jgi:hypothetical protein